MSYAKTTYQVIRDSREQNGWDFPKGGSCEGTVVEGLPTGDYTLRGFEKEFVIERKGSIAEFAQNVTQPRFERELERLEAFKHPFLILEFNIAHILSYPVGSDIPRKLWPKIKISPHFILKKLNDYQLKYKVKVITAGAHGKELAESLFKRIVEHA